MVETCQALSRGVLEARYNRRRILFDDRFLVSKQTSQKNKKKIFKTGSRYFIGKDKKTSALLNDLTAKLSQKKTETIKEYVIVEIEIFTNTLTKDKKRRSKKTIDLDNAAQGPIDSLVKAKILEDDHYIDELHLYRTHSETESIRIMIWAKE